MLREALLAGSSSSSKLYDSKDDVQNLIHERSHADEAHAREAGKISLKCLCFYICDFIQ